MSWVVLCQLSRKALSWVLCCIYTVMCGIVLCQLSRKALTQLTRKRFNNVIITALLVWITFIKVFVEFFFALLERYFKTVL